jgi:hypothetical protein
MTLLMAGLFRTHPVSEEVSSQLTWSLFNGTNEKSAEFDPALFPLSFHWYDGAVPPFNGIAVQ